MGTCAVTTGREEEERALEAERRRRYEERERERKEREAKLRAGAGGGEQRRGSVLALSRQQSQHYVQTASVVGGVDESVSHASNGEREHRLAGDAGAVAAAAAARSKLEEEDFGDLTKRQQKARSRVQVSSLSRDGYFPYVKKYRNQDRRFCRFALQNDSGAMLFAVLQGHGRHGCKITKFVRDKFSKHLEGQALLLNKPKRALRTAVKYTIDDLSMSKLKCDFSGCVAVFVLVIRKRLYVANIGTGRALIVRTDGSHEQLTTEHVVGAEGERERILEAGGRIAPRKHAHDDVERVWLAEADVPGLKMSRTLGDEVAHTVGVTSTPEIRDYRLGKNDSHLVLGTDGVWQFLDNTAVAEAVRSYNDVGLANRALIDAALHAWEENEEVVDDITSILVKFAPDPSLQVQAQEGDRESNESMHVVSDVAGEERAGAEEEEEDVC